MLNMYDKCQLVKKVFLFKDVRTTFHQYSTEVYFTGNCALENTLGLTHERIILPACTLKKELRKYLSYDGGGIPSEG